MAKKAEIKLFGFITDWNENSAGNFTNLLDDAKSKNDEVLILMHCYGGNVMEANVIGNSIADGNKVSIKILGLAASMGGFLLPYAKHVSIVRNGYVMLHAPMGGQSGMSADDLETEVKVLRNMEKDFVSKLVAKTKQPEDVVKGWLAGDHWFTAQEAKDLGIVDEIIESVVDIEVIAKADLKAFSAQSLYDRFAVHLKDKTFNNQLNNFKMNKPEFIARYGLSGVDAESSEADIYAALDKKMQKERTDKEAAQNNLQAEKDKQITAVVKAAVGTKITAAQEATFVTIGKTSGIEALQAALDAINPMPTITGMLGGGASGSGTLQNRADWNWDKWEKEDSKGLEALAKTNYDSFNALYKGKFGVDAPK